MKHNNTDWYGVQSPFWVLSTQLKNPDFANPSSNEIKEVLSEAIDIDATIEGDVDLDYVKFRIKLNDFSWISTGLWLWKVRFFKLHKKIYNMTFKDFCNTVVGKNYTTCLDMIKGSTVWMALSTRGYEVLPYSIAQCVALHKYLDDEEIFFDTWEYICANLAEHEFSAKAFAKLLDGAEGKKSTVITFPLDLFDKLYNTACHVGLSIIELVSQMHYEMFGKVVHVPPNIMERWQLDLAVMISEQDALLRRD